MYIIFLLVLLVLLILLYYNSCKCNINGFNIGGVGGDEVGRGNMFLFENPDILEVMIQNNLSVVHETIKKYMIEVYDDEFDEDDIKYFYIYLSQNNSIEYNEQILTLLENTDKKKYKEFMEKIKSEIYNYGNALKFAETFLKNVNYDINYNYEETLNTITFNLSREDKIKFGISTDKMTIPIFNSISYIPYIIKTGEIINIYFFVLYWNLDLHGYPESITDNELFDEDETEPKNFNTHQMLLKSIKENIDDESLSLDINEDSEVSDGYTIKEYDNFFFIPGQLPYNGYSLSDTEYLDPEPKYFDVSFIQKTIEFVTQGPESNPNVIPKQQYTVDEDTLTIHMYDIIRMQDILYSKYMSVKDTIDKCNLPDYLCKQHECNWLDNRCLTDSYCNNLSDCNVEPLVCESNDGICKFKN